MGDSNMVENVSDDEKNKDSNLVAGVKRRRSDSSNGINDAVVNKELLPEELRDVDFTKRISWRKEAVVVKHGDVEFSREYPALCFQVHAVDGYARASTVHLPQNRRIPTPMFMPVGTKGTIKSLTPMEIYDDIQCPIILANTYHLALQPGTELVRDQGGLHQFMGLSNNNNRNTAILTDSGGFQMVSLLKLAEITEEGVTFDSPYDEDGNDTFQKQQPTANDKKGKRMLLRPEDSIEHQNNIGADIIMALDDVVSSVTVDDERYRLATYRTLRWLDRCLEAHSKPQSQNLFAIVQGGLDVRLGGLREQCLAGFRHRDDKIPGYAIGGLAGGESKDDFWKVVHQCCMALPNDKPRYLMGVGYPLDLVICTALGVDMYDCVYPTRTARFGVALAGEGGQLLRLKANSFQNDHSKIEPNCQCQACQHFTRAKLHTLLKTNNPLASTLMTHHNITYMMTLVSNMRTAIQQQSYASFCHNFVQKHFYTQQQQQQQIPQWIYDALEAADIPLPKHSK